MSNSQDLERRYYPVAVEVREAGEDDEPVIEGLAAVYNQESEDLGGFVEIIEPGFFDDVLNSDVRSLWNHNMDMILGRTKSGTLAIEDSAAGLRTTTRPPDNNWGRDALVSIRRGDVDQMSFAFRVKPDGDRWSQRDDGVMVRRLLPGGAAELYDISPVTIPAYPQTSVAVRSKLAELGQETAGAAADAETDESQATSTQARQAARRRQLQLKTRGV